MKLTRNLSFAFALSAACGLAGCKTPMSLLSRPASSQSTAPDVQYNGMTPSFSTTVRQNGATAAVSSAQPADGVVTKAWKSTTGAVNSAFATITPGSDATSLAVKPGKIKAETYLSAAVLHEQAGQLEQAEEKYRQALKVEPGNLKAMLRLARLYDSQDNTQAAIAVYNQALKLHPKNATIYNDLGLCYGRRHELAPAQQMLQKAVQLEPSKANYRNNLATVLVDMNRTSEAYQQLVSVQPEGVAHYNLAFLLNSRGQREPAVSHLRQALASDPTLTPARELLAQLDGPAQPKMQTVSASPPKTSPAPARTRQGNPQMQMNSTDLQPPEISVGPQVPPAGNDAGSFRISDQGSHYRRTSHDEEVVTDVPPAPIRLTDDDEEAHPAPASEPMPAEERPAAEEPATDAEPAMTEAPATDAEPATAEAPATAEEPATPAEPTASGEPVAADEPASAAEPAPEEPNLLPATE